MKNMKEFKNSRSCITNGELNGKDIQKEKRIP